MRRSLVLALISAVLLGLMPMAQAAFLPLPPGSGDGLGTPGQLPADALPPTPVCQTESPAKAGKHARRKATVKVGTYNVLHTQDRDGRPTAPQRIGMLADTIEASGADALGLQEVAKSANLAGLDNDDDGISGLMVELIAQRLAASTKEHWHWCWFASNAHIPYEPEPNPGGGGGPLTELASFGGGQQTGNGDEFREGVAILSRYKITKPSVRRLALRAHEAAYCDEVDPIGCQFAVVFDSRVIMRAVINGPAGDFDLYTTHIAHGVTSQSDDTKQRHIDEGLAYIGETEDKSTPTFYVGDFNSDRHAENGTPGRDRYASIVGPATSFLDMYLAAPPGARDRPDFTGGQEVVTPDLVVTADVTIDFVFAQNLRRCRSTEGRVIGDFSAPRVDEPGDPTNNRVWPSDHFGVVTTIDCAKKKK